MGTFTNYSQIFKMLWIHFCVCVCLSLLYIKIIGMPKNQNHKMWKYVNSLFSSTVRCFSCTSSLPRPHFYD